jgi:uncharacterized protein (UPF0333 family)
LSRETTRVIHFSERNLSPSDTAETGLTDGDSVTAQVIARLYSSHFSTENAVADTVALTANTAAGTADAIASTVDTVASTDNAGTNADNNSDSSYEYHMDDEAYDSTYDPLGLRT